MAFDLLKKTWTEVSETFRPQRGKNHPVTEQRFVKGGHQQFGSLVERNAFPAERRAKYMTCTVHDVSYILLDNLLTWAPFDRGYLILNPKITNEQFYTVFPFRFAVLSVTAKDAVVNQGFSSGNPNEKQTLICSGSEGSVVTFEIARIYVDITP